MIQGKISFVLVRLRIKHMELAIIRRETSGAGVQQFSESESLLKYELMDGAPVKAEVGARKQLCHHTDTLPSHITLSHHPFKPPSIVFPQVIPIRLFLSRLDLTPTYRAVNNVFSVKYFVNLVLVDEEDRRYFKQQEIVFWRMNQESLVIKYHRIHPLSADNPSATLSTLCQEKLQNDFSTHRTVPHALSMHRE